MNGVHGGLGRAGTAGLEKYIKIKWLGVSLELGAVALRLLLWRLPLIFFLELWHVMSRGLSIAILTWGMANSALANDIQVISEARLESLASDYRSGASPSADQLAKPWNCDLFGVRSRMQVQKHEKYYDFSADKAALRNSGLAPMRQFNMSSNEWSASNGRWTERLRITSDGTLVSQLTAADDGRVLAYAHCQSAKGKL